MSTSRKRPFDEQPTVRKGNKRKALRLLQHWLDTDEASDDTSDWESLKADLDKHRPLGQKLFPENEKNCSS